MPVWQGSRLGLCLPVIPTVKEHHRGLEPEGTEEVVSPIPSPFWRSGIECPPKGTQVAGGKRTDGNQKPHVKSSPMLSG